MAFYNRLINKTFRKHGLSVRPDAATEIKAYLRQQEEENSQTTMQRSLDTLVEAIKAKGLPSSFVDLEAVQETTQLLKQQASSSEVPDFIKYTSAFDMPRYKLDPVRKTLHRVDKKTSLHGTAEDKALVLRDRWQILYNRLMRNDIFSAPALAQGPEDGQQQHYKITMIEALIGRPGRKCIFGMLTQLVDDKWFIEDNNSAIQVDLTDAQITAGLFVENCMVLAEGELVDNTFYVSTLGFPPSETYKDTTSTYPQLSCIGLDADGRDKDKEKEKLAQQLHVEHADDMVIILSDVHLDKPKVMQQLETLFRGYQAAPDPSPLFVLMGSFVSREMGCGAKDVEEVRGYFDALGDLLLKFPDLIASSKFLLIPGPNDLSVGGKVLPCPPLARVFTEKLKKNLGDALILGSNPSRILYCTHEMVFFRHDLLHHLRRNCVVTPSEQETQEISEHLVRTVLDQAHLCPLPAPKLPVYWQFDHALTMYPVPHALILADVVDQYNWNYEGCEAFNPGPFAVDSSFVVYRPATGKTEFSRIPEPQ